MELSPQALIAGRYRADHKVGVGATGEVWEGQHITVGSKVAIKRLLPAGSLQHEMVARFKREAYLLGRVRSDYVARVLDFVNDAKYGLVLIMEFVEGDCLYDLVQARRYSVEQAILLGADVVAGVTDLHRAQVVHRDLKPGNIIIEPRPRVGQRAVLVDFGMSRLMTGGNGDGDEDLTGITRVNVALGTLEYMAPEQILNSRTVSGSADVYAAGAILYRAVAGRHAFVGASDARLAQAKLSLEAPPLVTGRGDAVARRFEVLVARAMRRRPDERFASAEEMLAELHRLRDALRREPAPLSTPSGARAFEVAADSSRRPLASSSTSDVRPSSTSVVPSLSAVASTPPAPHAPPRRALWYVGGAATLALTGIVAWSARGRTPPTGAVAAARPATPPATLPMARSASSGAASTGASSSPTDPAFKTIDLNDLPSAQGPARTQRFGPARVAPTVTGSAPLSVPHPTASAAPFATIEGPKRPDVPAE